MALAILGAALLAPSSQARGAPPDKLAVIETDKASSAPPFPRRVARVGKSERFSGRSVPEVDVLLVDVTVNGQPLKSVARVDHRANGLLLLPVAAWSEARLLPGAISHHLSDGTAAYALNNVQGASWSLNRQALHLDIVVPASAFAASALGRPGPWGTPPPRPEPGAILNYDASLSHAGAHGRLGGGATLEAILFNGFGSFVTSAVARDNGRTSEAYRLESFWRYDLPHRMEALVVGDTVGVSGGWSRPARYAGVRWGRDFSMRPGFVTTPQLSLAGQATLPSTVDVLIDNARRFSQPVQPGPFDLTHVPLTSGAGEVNLVVRDLLGRQTVIAQSYYLSPDLLAPGLSDFSFEAGWLRRGYGRDISYDPDPFGSITWREGLSPQLTGEVRLEVQPDRQAAGVDLSGLLGHWAAARLALAASTRKRLDGQTENGQLLQLGLQRSTRGGGVSLQYEYATQGFAPFGEITTSSSGVDRTVGHRARETLFLGAGGALAGRVHGGLNYVQRQRWSGEVVKALGGSLSWRASPKTRLQLSLDRRLDGERDWRAALSVQLSLGKGITASTHLERSAAGEIGVTQAARSAIPAGPGLGWNVEASHLQGLRTRAGVQYNTSTSEWTAEASTWQPGEWATRVGTRGSVGWLAGMPFASRPVGQNSFAVISVDGIPDVPVKRSHQVVARTNDQGKAFVAGLLPWQANQIEIDPVDLPLDVEVDAFAKSVTPYPRSGALVTFDVRRSRQALLTLVQPNGDPVPTGARVRLLPDGPEFVAGRRGKVWLNDLPETYRSGRVQVRWNGSAGCGLELALPAPTDPIPALLSPLLCQ